MEQRTFASQGSFERYGRKSRRELFLDEMELVVVATAQINGVSKQMTVAIQNFNYQVSQM